jgi:hypothetical protein
MFAVKVLARVSTPTKHARYRHCHLVKVVNGRCRFDSLVDVAEEGHDSEVEKSASGFSKSNLVRTAVFATSSATAASLMAARVRAA